jgi:hypothetical protein
VGACVAWSTLAGAGATRCAGGGQPAWNSASFSERARIMMERGSETSGSIRRSPSRNATGASPHAATKNCRSADAPPQ